MSDTVTLSFRVPASKAEALAKLAKAQDRPKSYLLEKALDDYLEEEARFYAKVTGALANLDDGGPSVAQEEVIHWLESWGSDSESPPPKAKRRVRKA